ncbi:hypothetical protein BDQ17DRAFT_1437317 [Cyathus striatus]|nr:hypothetical protein BDQ17DRAFT_1437317 [Cyathus striatus]
MGAHPDAHKCRQFILFLYSDSVADEWYEELDSSQKTTWASLKVAFQTRWLKKMIVKKTKGEFKEEILSYELKLEELLNKEVIGESEVFKYVAWADKMLTLTTGTNVANGTTYLSTVCRKLPKPICDQTREMVADWPTFLDAVHKADIEVIREVVEEWEKREKLYGELTKCIQVLESPVAGLSAAMTNMNIAQHTLAMMTSTSGHTVPRQGGGRGAGYPQLQCTRVASTPFNNIHGQPEVLTEQELNILRTNLRAIPQQEDIPVGRAVHHIQQQEFHRQYGASAFIKFDTPYPLRPGTVEANSRECY